MTEKQKPAGQPRPIRDTLFGDMSVNHWLMDDSKAAVFPWDKFSEARAHLIAGRTDEALQCWRDVLARSDIDPRHHAQAWHFLRQYKQEPPPEVEKQLLGVVVEVTLPGGLDLLAAYPNYSARYYNYAGSGVIWERPNDALNPAIDELMEASKRVVSLIGTLEGRRPGPPPLGHARISFLTPSGLHLGQGKLDVLAKDSIGGPALQSATRLMKELMARTPTK